MAKTNLIWIMADQLRADMVGCNGDPNVHTPNIDALAAGGANFTRALSTNPLCCPARASMITGLYPQNAIIVVNKNNRYLSLLSQLYSENIPKNTNTFPTFSDLFPFPFRTVKHVCSEGRILAIHYYYS